MTDQIITIEGAKSGCFPANTKVLTPTGYKNISEFCKGDLIIAYNTDNVLAVCAVAQTHKHKVKDLRGDAILCVIHEGGNLKATANHWFYTPQGTYRELGDFLPGDFLVDTKGRSVEILDIIKMPDEKYVYNLTVEPYNTFIVEGIRVHNKGGGKDGGGSYRTPIEDPNSLQSNAVVRLIDLIGEGEISGLVNGDKSIYLDEVQLQQDGGTYNFAGTTTYKKKGTTAQTYIPGISDVAPSITVKNVQITVAGGGATHAVSDTDVDDVRVVLQVSSLFVQNDYGDVLATSVVMAIDIQPNGGGWQNNIATVTFSGKCVSTYQKAVRINNLASYGTGPWTIRVRRITADPVSVKTQNYTYWYAISEIKNRKIPYRESALVGFEVDVKSFGQNIPNRAYDVKGLLIQVPDNRTYNSTLDTATYNGAWGGSFKTEWCDNPAWVLYDILTNTRYGLGIDPDYVDIAALYTIGVYCDAQVDDGFGGTERRFTFNTQINNSTEAYHLINMICSNMRVMPYWSAGLVTFAQDSPKDATRLVTAANVENGMFNYSSSAMKDRHTVANVTWNDPDDFYRQAVEVVEDTDGIDRYGYRPIDVIAYACTSRGQAYRYGKWILETELYETELLTYVAGFDHMDCAPGEIINVADPHNSLNNRFGGRLVSCSSTSAVLDASIELDAGDTYTISMMTSSGTVVQKTVTNSAGITNTITWANSLLSIPQAGSVWVIGSPTDLDPKPYRVVKVREIDKHKYEVNAVFHDINKYARIESGIYLEQSAYMNLPEGELAAPTNINVEGYTYLSDENKNRQYGVDVSWQASTDPRTIYYEVEYKPDYAPYEPAGTTSTVSYNLHPLSSGTYNFRVRGVGLTLKSAWLTYLDYNLVTYSGLGAPTSIVSMGLGNTTFSGADCGITWTAPTSVYYNDYAVDAAGFIKDYKVETRQTDGTLLHTDFVTDTSYIYTYNNNVNDNKRVDGGSAQRSLMFRVYARYIYDNLSNYATATITNPAPSMAGLTPDITEVFAGLKVDWSDITPTDTDGSKFIIYCDKNATPTTAVAEVGWETRYLVIPGLDTDSTYYVRIEPYDLFGAGTKSSTKQGDPLKVSEIDIDAELSSSITITTSETTVSGNLYKLYDRNLTSNGVAFTGASTEDWVNYDFGIEYFIDRVSVWSAGAANVYVAYASNDEVWHYLRGEADHTLDTDGELVVATNQADAQTNYWTLAAGKNVAIFPQGIIARNCRLYIKSNQTIYELKFGREVIAEFVVADNLSAISADLGTISAGTIQSPDYPSSGLSIDVDTGDIHGAVTFMEGSNPPVQNWAHPTDVTKIDGGEISVGSRIYLEEGGLAIFGGNVMIDTFGSVGSVIVSADTTLNEEGKLDLSEVDYAHLTDGDLVTYYYDGSSHISYKGLNRVEIGVASNNVDTVIPGVWKSPPKIMLFPDTLQSYNANYSSQNQTAKYEILNLDTYATYGDKKQYQFTPKATLQLAAGTGGAIINETFSSSDTPLSTYTTLQSSTYDLAANTRRLVVSTSSNMVMVQSSKYFFGGKGGGYEWYTTYYRARWYIYLYYYSDGAWNTIYQYIDPGYGTYSDKIASTLDTGTKSYDITQFYVKIVYSSLYVVNSYVPGLYDNYTQKVLVINNYSSDLTSATVIATGTVGWIAIGS